MTIATEAKERPIIFGAESVRAILHGRKTQTRRVVSPQPYPEPLPGGKYPPSRPFVGADGIWRFMRGAVSYDADDVGRCRFGRPLERLWVRETLSLERGRGWYYNADQSDVELDEDHPAAGAMISWAYHKETDFCTSIHMPRWASRITLEVTAIRVERLQEITMDDAVAEGTLGDNYMAREGYRDLWDSLNAKRGYGWEKNPFVWVIRFERVR